MHGVVLVGSSAPEGVLVRTGEGVGVTQLLRSISPRFSLAAAARRPMQRQQLQEKRENKENAGQRSSCARFLALEYV
jgi:hypothetical protein